jgi:putative transposase
MHDAADNAAIVLGAPYNRGEHRIGQRWGTTKSKIGLHGGKVAVHRPRVRSYDGREVELPTWTAAKAEDWLARWVMNLMLINISTRKLWRAVRLPDGDLPAVVGDGTSQSAASDQASRGDTVRTGPAPVRLWLNLQEPFVFTADVGLNH